MDLEGHAAAGRVPRQGSRLGRGAPHESPPSVRGMHVEDIAPYRDWRGSWPQSASSASPGPRPTAAQGSGPAEQMIVNAELRAAGCAGIVDHIAIGELGPTIIAHGSEEQKQRYLAPMLHGDEGWCQLFSEPAAGSDLAGVQTARSAPRPAGASPARRSGRRWPSTPTTACCSRGRTPTCPKHRGPDAVHRPDARATG